MNGYTNSNTENKENIVQLHTCSFSKALSQYTFTEYKAKKKKKITWFLRPIQYINRTAVKVTILAVISLFHYSVIVCKSYCHIMVLTLVLLLSAGGNHIYKKLSQVNVIDADQ